MYAFMYNDDNIEKERIDTGRTIKRMKICLYSTFAILLLILVIVLFSVLLSFYDNKTDEQKLLICAILKRVCNLGRMQTLQNLNGTLEGVVFYDGANDEECMNAYNSHC